MGFKDIESDVIVYVWIQLASVRYSGIQFNSSTGSFRFCWETGYPQIQLFWPFVSHSNDTLRYALFLDDTHKWQCLKFEWCFWKKTKSVAPVGHYNWAGLNVFCLTLCKLFICISLQSQLKCLKSIGKSIFIRNWNPSSGFLLFFARVLEHGYTDVPSRRLP